MGRTINVDVETDSTVAIGMCSRSGVGKTRHIQIRWLWIQDAIRDKVVRLRKVRGTDNNADMGTKDLDGPTSAPIAETAAQANPLQTALGLDRDSKRRERCGSAEVFSTSDDCDTDSIGDVGLDKSTTSEETARSNSSGNDC